MHRKFPGLLNWKEQLVTAGIIFACLFLYFFFPAADWLEKMVSSCFFLFVVPMLYIKFVLKKSPAEFGWQAGSWTRGIFSALLMLVFCFLVFYLLLHYARLQDNYLLTRLVRENFWFFLFYEFSIAGLLLFLYTFFFSGFVLFSYAPFLGPFAPLLPFFLFCLFLLASSAFSWQNYAYILLSFPVPFAVFRGRSLLYPFLAGILFLLVADALIIKLPNIG